MKLRRSAVVALGVLVTGACALSGTSSANPAVSSGLSAASGSAAGYHPVTNFMAFVGGHAGPANAKLSPVEIGVYNQQGGSADFAPEWTVGTTVAAEYINKDIGGIDGHPVKLVTCFVPDTVANAAQCGQQLANDSGVQAIAAGELTIGNQALESALAPTKKVLVWGVALSPIDTTYKTGFILDGDSTHVEAPLATFAKDYLHAKSVAIVYPDVAGGSVGPDITAAALKQEGVKVKVVGYDPSTTDLTGPLTAAGVATASVFLADANAGPASCSDMYKAVKQLNIKTPVLTNVPCDSAQVATGDGGTLPIGWYYAAANPLPGDAGDPSLPAFNTVAKQFGESKWTDDTWVPNAFAQVLTIAKYDTDLLKAGKPLTAANIDAAAKAFKGPVPQGPQVLTCGSLPAAPAVCNEKDSFFQNTAPGVFKAIVRFIGPPPGFQIPAGLQ